MVYNSSFRRSKYKASHYEAVANFDKLFHLATEVPKRAGEKEDNKLRI
jgi:hypothetical protein